MLLLGHPERITRLGLDKPKDICELAGDEEEASGQEDDPQDQNDDGHGKVEAVADEEGLRRRIHGPDGGAGHAPGRAEDPRAFDELEKQDEAAERGGEDLARPRRDVRQEPEHVGLVVSLGGRRRKRRAR